MAEMKALMAQMKALQDQLDPQDGNNTSKEG
jgi:hypothetical protein